VIPPSPLAAQHNGDGRGRSHAVGRPGIFAYFAALAIDEIGSEPMRTGWEGQEPCRWAGRGYTRLLGELGKL
jgi:hypothetical protein